MASSSRQKSGSSGSKGRKAPLRGQQIPQVNMESRTIGSIRMQREREKRAAERKERVQREKRRSRVPFIIIGVVVFLAISTLVAYFVLINTDVFQIEEIEFTGTEHLTKEEVGALVNIPKGTTLLNIDAKGIESSLRRDAWVKAVTVKREFPNKLVIQVVERTIGAVVEVPTGVNQVIQDWAISDDGVWLMAIPERDSEVGRKLSEQIFTDASKALHITGVPYGIAPKIGAYCTDESVVTALEIISDMTTSLKNRIKKVTATDAESTLLTLDNNVEIAFGNATNIREKERICLEIMEQNPSVVYINVRIPDRPTWRAA